MKNKILILLIISTLNVVGQNHFIGVNCGINQTNITSNNFINKSDNRTGLLAGITYEYLFKEHFSIGADLNYNQRGFTNEVVFADNLGNLTGEKFTYIFNYDYFSIPIKIGFNIGNKFYGFTNVGVIPSILVGAKTTSPILDKNGKVSGIEIFDVTSIVSKVDFAGLIEIGGGYKFDNRFCLISTFSYQPSFTTIANEEYFANSNIRFKGMTLSLGLKYQLTSK